MLLREDQEKPSKAWIHLRVTGDEKTGLARLARIAKVSVSDYVRFCLRLTPLKRKKG